jgi:ribosomal protein S3
VDKLREELQLLTKKDILLNIVEVRKPELDAQLVADSVARQLEGRISFRRAMKKSLAATMKMGAQGIKIQCGGRLGGAEIARTEKYMDGRVPLHTLRADIDYATATANTTYGTIGVKVWICRGEIMETGKFYGADEEAKPGAARDTGAPPARDRRARDGARDRGRGAKRPRGRLRRSGQKGPAPRGRRPEQRPASESDEAKTARANEKKEAKSEAKPKAKSAAKPKAKSRPKSEAKAKTTSETKPRARAADKKETKPAEKKEKAPDKPEDKGDAKE